MFPVDLFHYWRYGKVSCSKSNLEKNIHLKISIERLQTKVIISEIEQFNPGVRNLFKFLNFLNIIYKPISKQNENLQFKPNVPVLL